MKQTEKSILIQNYLDKILPNAGCELTYNKDYEFLIAVMLSAQCTDKKVNQVTPVLFDKYKTLKALNDADIKDIEEIIKPLGLYKNKAKNIKNIASDLIYLFNSVLPKEKNDLTKLTGVGNKTAEVVRIEIFKEPEFPVDTHVARVSKRLGLTKEEDEVTTIGTNLRKIFPKDKRIKLHHQFIHFGRYFCKAQNPSCKTCELKNICKNHAK